MITTTTIMLAALTVDAQTQNVRKPRNIFGFLDPFNLLGTNDCKHSSRSKLVELPGEGCYCNKSQFKCHYGDLCYKDKGCKSCQKSLGCLKNSAKKGESCKVSAECNGSNLYCDDDDKKCREHFVEKPIFTLNFLCNKDKKSWTREKNTRICNNKPKKCPPSRVFKGIVKSTYPISFKCESRWPEGRR